MPVLILTLEEHPPRRHKEKQPDLRTPLSQTLMCTTECRHQCPRIGRQEHHPPPSNYSLNEEIDALGRAGLSEDHQHQPPSPAHPEGEIERKCTTQAVQNIRGTRQTQDGGRTSKGQHQHGTSERKHCAP
ncbi:hypothetical protein ASPBRDRAFT_48899 [Aspergillus brasiliensis CBS 101740]|uniref:Uncharacterized protein n=1 Tax=Aspergillus brasiliensis (strain CBS 101740 / IMI 381727 / IBT 21946) TaxID=767769 RepID=A0A1L9U4K6_ASPBC|nr:hypothetical protein ASPBRDRAFT_48899 [Aspergillus brasiliensis CBS 101740]